MNNQSLYSKEKIKKLRRKLIIWFKKNARKYPWRETEDPFKVLIAEMMLRRTRADQVVPVYETLFKSYPDIKRILSAKNSDFEKVLYPLGLMWRIPAFKKVALEIKQKFNNKVPSNRKDLLSLTGVGEYVAGAVLSIAFNKKEWIVDSNIVRLFRRYFNISTSKEGRRDKHVIEMAKIYANCSNPKKANLAILDFTALVCKPMKPECQKCILASDCIFYKQR